MVEEITPQSSAQTSEAATDVLFAAPVDEASSPDESAPFSLATLTPETVEAPAEKLPAETAGETEQTQAAPKVEGEEAAPEATTETTTEDDEAAQAAELESDLQKSLKEIAGVEDVEAPSDPVWQQRYNDERRSYQELNDRTQEERDAIATALNEAGRKLIDTPQGVKIVASDDAKAVTAEDLDLARMWNECSDTEQAAFGEVNARAAFDIAAVKLANEYASRVTPTTAKPNDAMLSQRDQDDIYNSFATETKPGSTELRFPDVGDAKIEPVFIKVLQSPDKTMTWLRENAAKDPLAYSAWLRLAYETTGRIMQPVLAKAAAAKRLKATKDTELKEAATVEGASGGGASGQGDQGVVKTVAQTVEANIFGDEEENHFQLP